MPGEKNMVCRIHIDEAGTLSGFNEADDVFILGCVFHKDSDDYRVQAEILKQRYRNIGVPDSLVIHMYPLISKMGDFKNYTSPAVRGKIAAAFKSFVVDARIRWESFVVDKQMGLDRKTMTFRDPSYTKKVVTRELESFLTENNETLSAFQKVVIYYDDGQPEILSLLKTWADKFPVPCEVKNDSVHSGHYMHQIADYICYMERLKSKYKKKGKLSQNEIKVLGDYKKIEQVFLNPLNRKKGIKRFSQIKRKV